MSDLADADKKSFIDKIIAALVRDLRQIRGSFSQEPAAPANPPA